MRRISTIWLAILILGVVDQAFGVGGDFTLTADDGSEYSLEDSRGRVVVLSFGYTFCPDVCPTALSTVAIALNRLNPDEAEKVDPLFVSLDPDRDTLERLSEYTRYFHPRLRGLTGDVDQLDTVAEAYRVRYNFVGKGETTHYTMDHSGGLYLIDPQGKLFRILPHGLPPQALVDSLRFALLHPDRTDPTTTQR